MKMKQTAKIFAVIFSVMLLALAFAGCSPRETVSDTESIISSTVSLVESNISSMTDTSN